MVLLCNILLLLSRGFFLSFNSTALSGACADEAIFACLFFLMTWLRKTNQPVSTGDSCFEYMPKNYSVLFPKKTYFKYTFEVFLKTSST